MRYDIGLSKYGCMRYLALPWAQTVRRAAVDGFTPDGAITSGFENVITEKVMHVLLDITTEKRPKEEWAGCRAIILEVARSAAMHGAWQHSGRQIFELAPKLVAAFRLTDVTHSSFEGLHLPYRAFFLHFGLQRDLVFQRNRLFPTTNVDGAYVVRDADGSVVIELTLFDCDTPARSEPGPTVLITPELATLGAEDAIDRAIDREVGWLRNREPVNLDSISLLENARILDEARPALRAAATLISNALFYLSEPHDDVTTTVEEGAPQALVDRAQHGAGNRQRKARQSLSAEGYAVVRYCGRRFSLPGTEGDGTGDPRATHWRRGHWRNQRCGPRLSQIKRLWIKPVLVGAEHGEPERGRVYLVGEHAGTESAGRAA